MPTSRTSAPASGLSSASKPTTPKTANSTSQDLYGADEMDTGSYKGGIGSLRAVEFGVQQIRKDVPK